MLDQVWLDRLQVFDTCPHDELAPISVLQAHEFMDISKALEKVIFHQSMKVLELKGIGKDLVLANYKHVAIWEDVAGDNLKVFR